MKHFRSLAALAALLLLSSCAENIETSAARYLDAARKASACGRYDEAKQFIDSIKILYPKAFEARKTGIVLLREVEIAETTRTLAYADSMLTLCRSRIDALVPKFIYERDERYEEVGRFVAPAQRLEDNLERNYLRATVDEQGHMSLTSLYRGAAYIDHTSLRVSIDDNWAETPATGHLYKSSDALAKTERCDFTLGEDGGVIAFIAAHSGQPVKVEYRGAKTYTTTLTRADSRSIADVYELALLLQEATRLSGIADEASRKISFFENKATSPQP